VGELNYFYTDINQLAETTDEEEDTGVYPIGTSRVYQNVGGIDVHGLEAEIQGKSAKEIGLGIIPRIVSSTFWLNYSFQDAKDSDTHQPVPDIARHKGNIGINFNLSAAEDSHDTLGVFRTFSDEFSLYFNLFLCGERLRSSDDLRAPLPGYGILDMTLTAHDLFDRGLDFSFAIKNLLDEEYHDPSPEFSEGSMFSTIPGDFPAPGRAFFVEFRYKF
jgi:outer membrane receptor protein involved in Fe transport